MNGPSRHPYATAIEWVAKITTVALEMILPAVAGSYLDRQWGTRYWALVGLVLGGTVGFWHLLKMTGRRNQAPRQSNGPADKTKDSPSGPARR